LRSIQKAKYNLASVRTEEVEKSWWMVFPFWRANVGQVLLSL